MEIRHITYRNFTKYTVKHCVNCEGLDKKIQIGNFYKVSFNEWCYKMHDPLWLVSSHLCNVFKVHLCCIMCE